MGRVRTNIVIKGRNFWTLFDTGARNTYVVQYMTSLLPTFELEKPEPVSLGGGSHKVAKICWLTCLVEGLPVHTHARVLEGKNSLVFLLIKLFFSKEKFGRKR